MPVAKYILQNHEAISEPDLITWARWMEENNLTIASTQILPNVLISTVFLGLDYSHGSGPLELFETLIIGGERDHEVLRYATYEQAEEGHARIVEELRKESNHVP